MVTNNVQNIIKMAVNHKKINRIASDTNKCNEKISESARSDNRTVTTNKSKNLLSNINSNLFAMLLQRTTFTVLMIVLLCCSSINAEATTIIPTMNVEDATVRSSPIYIPLTEASPTETSFVEEIVKENNANWKHSNRSYETGNSLWDGFLNECSANPSLSCIQKNVYTYFDESLKIDGDVNVTEGFMFKKNKLAHWKYNQKVNAKVDDDDESVNEVDSDENDQARFSGLYYICDFLVCQAKYGMNLSRKYVRCSLSVKWFCV